MTNIIISIIKYLPKNFVLRDFSEKINNIGIHDYFLLLSHETFFLEPDITICDAKYIIFLI